MGNWKLARWQEPKTLTRDVLREMRRGRPAGCHGARSSGARSAVGVGLWLLEVTGGLLGFLWPNLSRGFGGTITLGDFDARIGQPGRAGRDAARRRAGVLLAGPHLRPADRPHARLRRRRQQRRRGAEHQRAHALPALSAPRLQAQLLHHQLLVRVPVPRLALRPTRHQGARSSGRRRAAWTASRTRSRTAC